MNFPNMKLTTYSRLTLEIKLENMIHIYVITMIDLTWVQ